MTNNCSIDQSDIWVALKQHQQSLHSIHLGDLFADDEKRGLQFSAQAVGIYFDYSKNHITEATLELFEQLAGYLDLDRRINALYSGASVNQSESCPALHPALRQVSAKTPEQNVPALDKVIKEDIHRELNRMLEFAEALRTGSVTGSTGQSITDIVLLGIGGSALGPQLVTTALGEQFGGLKNHNLDLHFVANIDSDDIDEALSKCQPDSTLFIISSKSFSTLETLSNAQRAKQWLTATGIKTELLKTHFIAITSDSEKALAWGIDPQRILTIGKWIGGRYSLWSAMGLPAAIALGKTAFQEMLAGAAAMDSHFQSTPWRRNLPVLHGLISIWQINFWQYKNRAVLPYAHKLRQLPDYLQQLITESLGKSVTQSGEALSISTGQVIWGGEESQGQHSFHQLLLQGTDPVPVDFILTRQPHCAETEHRQLYANCLAQSQALMLGTTDSKLSADNALGGNRPSNTLILDQLSPSCLGALLALYEHSVYVQSLVWNINAFDQWGVEQGKRLGEKIFANLEEKTEKHRPKPESRYDSSTDALIQHYRK